VVDLGCGTGEVARHLARTRPDVLVLAVDVHSASVATLLRDVADEALANLRVHHGDGVELLRGRIEPASLELLTVLFPDPWPKARHRHRRLVEPGFAALAADRLADGGVIRLATDRHDYATQMRSVLAARADLEAFAVTARSDDQPVTFYEARAQAAGRPVHELAFVRRARNLPGPTPPDD
jgi:tRNA (guanine-N7-)-methyltransferase